jgi:hypothetical protein
VPKVPNLKNVADTVVSGAKTVASAATHAGADAAEVVAKAGKAVANNEVVQDLVLDAVEYVAPRTAKRLEAQMRPSKPKKVAAKKKAAPKAVSAKSAAVKKKPRPQ